MKFEYYVDVRSGANYNMFDFTSEGHNGNIPKRILFTPTPWPNIYNLAFGDITDDEDIDDSKISDNGDRNKILATVVRVVEIYTNVYPERWIYFTGSTEQRTRLYRMAVSIYYEELSSMFELFAETKGKDGFVRFQKGLNVNAFLIKKKFIKFGL